ncbi:MAG: FtsW/RodA/SpoVE family cell cycle protein, partial [Defluviitaleaceae bacterium]|nr:FtsW/RodA/SpoVE family cell cycle protein [Defluviitaleaceae bacterium]
ISRYFFILCILSFLVQAFFYVAAERGRLYIDQRAAIRLQRWTIALMIIIAFSILGWQPEYGAFDTTVLATGAIALVFFIMTWTFSAIIYRDSCPLMWNCVLFLMGVGIIMLQRLDHETAVRQLMWFFLGFSMTLFIPPFIKVVPKFEKLEPVYLAAGFGLLLSPLLFGLAQYGAMRWVNFFGVTFQPSELVKFLLVFYLASVFRKKQTLISLLIPAGAVAVFVVMLVLQRDLGGALIFFMTFMVMLYIATGNPFLFAGGFAAASVASVFAYRLFPHVRVRVTAWEDPFADIAGMGFQIAQSWFAIGSWGWAGSGLTLGIPTAIPVVESDFIFAAICEEFGGVFAVGFIAVILVIFYRGMHIALRAERRYYALLAAGFSSILAFQSFLILGGVIKLIPLTGVTLPFVSAGGSSVVVCLLMIGILQWIYSYYRYDEAEEYDDAGEEGENNEKNEEPEKVITDE